MPIATNPETGESVYLDNQGQWVPAQTARNPQTNEMVVYDGSAWIKPKPPQSIGRMAADAGLSVASGATFGFPEEIYAKGSELLGRGSYDKNLQDAKQRYSEIPSSVRVPGEIGGAVAATLATAPVTGPLAAATGAARLPAWLRGAAMGGVGGGLFGAGNAEPGKRTEGALEGGVAGMGLGALTPSVLRGGQTLARELRGAFDPSTIAKYDVGRAMLRDKDTPADLVQRAADASQVRPGKVTIGDVGGENVRGLVERIAQTPGAGRTDVIPALTGSQQQQMFRLSTDLKTLTGTHKTAFQAINQTADQMKKDAAPLYDAAYNFNARQSPEIMAAWQREVADGWGRSVLMSPGFRKTLQTEYGITDPTNAPMMVVIDAWKREVDGRVGKALTSGNKTLAGVLMDMKDRVVSTVDQHNPAYRAARASWEGHSKFLSSIEEGKKIRSPDVNSEELAARFANMSASEQEGHRIGFVSSIISHMGNDPAKLADMTKYLRSPAMREKVATIMPDPAAADKWAKGLAFEVRSSELTSGALGNSATARRLAEREDQQGIMGDLIADTLSGSPSLWRNVVMAVPRSIRDSVRSRSDAVAADILLNPQSTNQIQSILRIAQRRAAGPSAVTNAATIKGETSLFD